MSPKKKWEKEEVRRFKEWRVGRGIKVAKKWYGENGNEHKLWEKYRG